MPKQIFKLNDFSGGLNLLKDPRDISSSELTQADNISLKVTGSVSTGNTVAGGGGGVTPVDVYGYPGGGIFYFETDKEGAAGAKDIGEIWVAGVDSTTGLLSLRSSASGTLSDVADMGTVTSYLFSANTIQFSGGTMIDRSNPSATLDWKDKLREGDVLRITGCTDVTANNRVVRMRGLGTTGNYINVTGSPFTSEPSEAGTVTFTIMAKGVFFASDDTLRVADGAFNTGLKRKQYGYVKQIHFKDAGVAKDSYDNWYANDCDLSSPTELHTTSASYPTAGTGFFLNITTPASDSDTIGTFAARTYQIAGTFIYRGDQESKLYIPSSNNTFTTVANDYVDIDVNASPAYDERITGGRIYMRPNGTNEPWALMIDMDLRDGCRTSMDDEYKPWAVGSDATEAGIDELILTSENFETYTILNGFGPEEFSISLSEFGESYSDSIIANRRLFICNVQMVDEDADTFTDATCDYNNDPTITMDSTAAIRNGMSVSGTGIPTGAYVASITNATTFELSASTTGGSVTNGTLTFGNIMKRMRDRIMYTPPNKYETFPRSFFIDVVRGDSDEYTALATFADRLFAFKRQTLYIINIGSPSPSNWFLESTEKHRGVLAKSAVHQSQNGIYWANRFGAFFFNGSSIINLLQDKIPKRSWNVSSDNANVPNVGFHEITNNLYVMTNNISTGTSGGILDSWVYNFDTNAWAKTTHAIGGGVEDKFLTNFIDDGNGGLVFNDMSTLTSSSSAGQSGISEADNGDSVAAAKWILKTKDMDFGEPGRIKKVYGLRVTYQSSAAQTTPISYATNGGSSFSNFTGNFVNTSGAWDVLYAYTASPVECQSMQIKITNPTNSGTININDISVEYRSIYKRVT